jgi:membrane protein DedA with SNARE-associated domain
VVNLSLPLFSSLTTGKHKSQQNQGSTTLTTEPPSAAPPLVAKPSLEYRQRLSTRQIIGRAAAIIFAIGITAAIVVFIPDIERFRPYGYWGVFLVSLLGNASIILPIPSLAVTFTMGALLSWPIVGLVAGIGEALGESTGYLAGLGGRAVIENRNLYDRLHYWMERYGLLTIFVLSIIPNPFIDLAGIAAGALKYSYYKFLLAAWAGKTIKTLGFAWAGAHSVSWLWWFIG